VATKRKYGKKNVIKIDPLAYNIGLIGESGIGKTTLAKEVCETLVGEDGYMIFNIGKEDGVDAIAGAVYEDIPDWETFDEVTKDIIENRDTDYKDLKIIVYDTFDQLLEIAEPEVVRLHNKENPDKRVKSINAAFGGFMKGQDKALEMVLDRIWELKKVGISMFVIGHTKVKTMVDEISGLEYDMLTTNMTQRYFNGIKTKLHVLGVASINRQIVQQNKGRGNKKVGQIVDESRIITFRDDNFNIDSKSRFADIVDSIPLDKDEFIKAIRDAIIKEHEKQGNGKSIEEVAKEQEKEKEKAIKQALEKTKEFNVERNKELIEQIKNNIANVDATEMQVIMKKYGFENFQDPTVIKTEALEKIVELIK